MRIYLGNRGITSSRGALPTPVRARGWTKLARSSDKDGPEKFNPAQEGEAAQPTNEAAT